MIFISVGSSCKNLLMLFGLILKLTPAFLPLMSFETRSLPDPLQLMSLHLFINHIKAETSDIHIGSIVDARAQVIDQVLHNIRITEWSSDKPTTACNGLIEWPRAKTIKILRDLEVVKTIPSSRMIHEHLISTKVVPQLSFFPHINPIPKPVLTKVQNHIADALWKGHPS